MFKIVDRPVVVEKPYAVPVVATAAPALAYSAPLVHHVSHASHASHGSHVVAATPTPFIASAPYSAGYNYRSPHVEHYHH